MRIPNYYWKRLRDGLPPALLDQLRTTLNAHDKRKRTGTPHHDLYAMRQLSMLAAMANEWREVIVYVLRDELESHYRRLSHNDALDAFEVAQRATPRQRFDYGRRAESVAEMEAALDMLRRVIAALARGETDGTRI